MVSMGAANGVRLCGWQASAGWAKVRRDGSAGSGCGNDGPVTGILMLLLLLLLSSLLSLLFTTMFTVHTPSLIGTGYWLEILRVAWPRR